MYLKNITIFFFLINLFSYGQKNGKEIIILDSLSYKPIQFANIKYLKSEYGTFSDSLGLFNFNKKVSEKVLISVLGYENKIIFNKNIKDTILLRPKTIVLDEISINTNSKQNYGYHTKNGKYIGSFIKRAVIAVYIKNENPNIKKLIHSLNFKIKKRGKFLSIVRPHLYSVNQKTNMPDKDLLDYNLLFKQQKRGKSTINIDINDKYIIFPKEGFFIALEWVGNTEDIDFSFSEKKSNGNNISTVMTSFNNEKIIWVPMELSENKSIFANFGVTTIKFEN